MKTVYERDYTTYPRQFKTYRWYKPLLVGLLFVVFYLLFASLVYLITRLAFNTLAVLNAMRALKLNNSI